MLERAKYDSLVEAKLDDALSKVEAMKGEGNEGVAGDTSLREGDEPAAPYTPTRPDGARRARTSKDPKEAAAYAAIGGKVELAGSLVAGDFWAGLMLDLDLPIGSVRPPLLNVELRDLVPGLERVLEEAAEGEEPAGGGSAGAAGVERGPVALEDVRLGADETEGLVELKLSGAGGKGVKVRFRFELIES